MQEDPWCLAYMLKPRAPQNPENPRHGHPDGIAIHVEVPRVDYNKLTDDHLGEPSDTIRRRVERARDGQRWRFEGTPLTCDADVGPGVGDRSTEPS